MTTSVCVNAHGQVRPQVITEPGVYNTRGGETVAVEQIGKYWATGHYGNGIRETWDFGGRLLPHSESPHDIVAKVPI